MSRYSDAYDPQIDMHDLGVPTRAEARADAATDHDHQPVVCDCGVCLTCAAIKVWRDK